MKQVGEALEKTLKSRELDYNIAGEMKELKYVLYVEKLLKRLLIFQG